MNIQFLLDNALTILTSSTLFGIVGWFFGGKQQKQIAIIKFEEAAYFDRYNADLQLIATLMGLSQEDLDDIFIKGNQI